MEHQVAVRTVLSFTPAVCQLWVRVAKGFLSIQANMKAQGILSSHHLSFTFQAEAISAILQAALLRPSA